MPERYAMTPSSDKYFCARIIERRDISADLWVIRVDPGGEYSFVPGQYSTLGVVTPEKHYERAYSIVSAPQEKLLEFFVELVPQGDVTPRLYPYQVGDEFTLRKVAKGRFTLDTTSGRTNHLLLATVTGVAPYVSFVRSLHRQWKEAKFKGEHKLFLLDGASRSWELGYRKELEGFAAGVPWLSYVPTVSRPWEDNSWKGETGRVDDLVRKYERDSEAPRVGKSGRQRGGVFHPRQRGRRGSQLELAENRIGQLDESRWLAGNFHKC